MLYTAFVSAFSWGSRVKSHQKFFKRHIGRGEPSFERRLIFYCRIIGSTFFVVEKLSYKSVPYIHFFDKIYRVDYSSSHFNIVFSDIDLSDSFIK